MTNQQDRRKVYLACRPIFSGDKAHVRNVKKVKQLIRDSKTTSLVPIFQTMKEEKIFDTVHNLLEGRVFESELKARVEFPDLFHSSPSRDARRQAPELEATQSVTNALDEVAFQEGSLDEAGPRCGNSSGVKQGAVKVKRGAEQGAASGSGPPVDGKGHPSVPGKGKEAIGVDPGAASGSGPPVGGKRQSSAPGKGDEAVKADPSHIPPSKPSPSLAGKVPELDPCYLPYETQHYILTAAQQALEECCFEFATKNMSSFLESKGWDCPAAVELTVWLRTLRDGSVETYVKPFLASIDARELKDVFGDLVSLRNSAVHREPVTAKGVSHFLESAVRLSQVLQDYRRAAQLGGLREELESKIGAMELHKALLEDTATAGLLDIQRQREELDRREKALIEETVSDDLQNSAFIGKLMEEHVLGMLGKGKRVWAPHGIVEDDGVDYRAERERIEQSLRADHEAGVNGVSGGPGGDDDDYYDSLEEITPGAWVDDTD